LIFSASIGTTLDLCTLLHNFKEILNAAGLPDIRFHEIKHTAPTHQLNHGIPPIVVSHRLGHSRVSITLDIYEHLIPEMQHEAAEIMDELMIPVEIGLHPVAPGKSVATLKEAINPNIKGSARRQTPHTGVAEGG
jgi:hypothetical protein